MVESSRTPLKVQFCWQQLYKSFISWSRVPVGRMKKKDEDEELCWRFLDLNLAMNACIYLFIGTVYTYLPTFEEPLFLPW